MIINELTGRLIECVLHQNGNHVIQKCVVVVPKELLSSIIDAFVGQVIEITNLKDTFEVPNQTYQVTYRDGEGGTTSLQWDYMMKTCTHV